MRTNHYVGSAAAPEPFCRTRWKRWEVSTTAFKGVILFIDFEPTHFAYHSVFEVES